MDYRFVKSIKSPTTKAVASQLLVLINKHYDIQREYKREATGERCTLRINNIAEVWDAHTTYVFAMDGDKLVGFISFQSRPIPKSELSICDIYVDDDYRGQGIGRALLEMTEEYAKRHNHGTLSLSVIETNTRAEKLYRSVGYRCEFKLMVKVI